MGSFETARCSRFWVEFNRFKVFTEFPPICLEPAVRNERVAEEPQSNHGKVLVSEPPFGTSDLSLDASMPDAFGEFFPASGSDGCESTGATTLGSVIIANAKPPVKHIPTAPTPRPPHS